MAEMRSDLAGGVRLVTDTMPNLETASVQIWVGAGARNETGRQDGLSHLLEHMAFKGTSRRSAIEIAEEIEAVGGDLNASTSHETTGYYARVMKDDVPLAIDILTDILCDSQFDAEELRREQNVIVQEIGAAHDTPDDVVHDQLQDAAFAGQPLGRAILGTPETVRSATADDLRGYLADHYHGPNIVVSAAGAVDHDALAKDIEARFEDLPDTPVAPAQDASYVGGDRNVIRDTEQYQVALALPTVGYLDDDFYTIRIAASVMGGAMSSRLFQEIRERRGLCYSVFSYMAAYREVGLFSVAAATAPETVPEMLDAIATELKRGALDISEKEVNRARAQAKSGIAMSLESASSRAEQIGRLTLMRNRIIPVSEILEKLDAITVSDVRDALGNIIARGPVSLATVGPKIDLESGAQFGEKLR